VIYTHKKLAFNENEDIDTVLETHPDLPETEKMENS